MDKKFVQLGVVTSILLLVLVAGCIGGGNSRNISIDKLKEEAINVSYDKLMRNTEDYIGEIVFFRCEIKNIDHKHGGAVGETYNYGENIWIDLSGKEVIVKNGEKVERILEEDDIYLWGQVTGQTTLYSEGFGLKQTSKVPSVDLIYAEVI